MFFGPGFDCDDLAEAFWAWLKHKQDAGEFPADADIEALWLYWRFTWGIGKGGKHGKAGHAVLVIHHNGYYYIVDDQTGEVYGPFPDTVPYKDIDWHEYFQDDFPSRNPDIIKEKHPTDRPWTDPSPWHEDSDRKDDIEDQTGNPAEDYIYPEESAN